MPGQRLFLLGSEQGNLLGLGPDTLQAGDFVWVTPGSERPFVFRSRQKHRKTAKDEGSHRGSTYESLGEPYVHGVMHGELFHQSALWWQDIVQR
jgi:hypothetical protein